VTLSVPAQRVLDCAGHTVSVPEAARALGISSWLAYELIKRGEFPVPTLRLGARHRVPTELLRRVLEENQ
jgi:predicted DNA-binding transcriptional regulator AlpA